MGAGEQDELFRRHYRQTYSGQRAEEFDRFKPAYQFGYRHGSLKELRDEPYMQVEPVLRRRYEEAHGEGSFDGVKEAVGYGYRLANATGSHPSGRDAK